MFERLIDRIKWWLHISPRTGVATGVTPVGFNAWIQFILDDEDPSVNESQGEPGGISKYGVSLTAYTDYAKANKLSVPTPDDIRNLTSADASNFYLWFFAPLQLDQFSAAVSYRIADCVVTLGQTGALRAIAFAIGIVIPAHMDAATVAAINVMDQKQLITGLSAAWTCLKWASLVPSGHTGGWAKYSHGWVNRRNKAHKRAIAMVV